MDPIMPVDELEKLIRAGAKAANAAGGAYEDGKLGLGDLDDLWALAGAMQDLMLVDFKQVVPQWKDLDEEERSYLSDLFEEELELPQENVEESLEGYLERSTKLYLAIRSLMDFHQAMWESDEEEEEGEEA